MGYLNQPEVRKLLPPEYRYIRFAWGKPLSEGSVVGTICIKVK